MGVRSRCLLQRSRRHGCDRKRRALATGEHRGEGQTGVRYVNIGARLAPRCWHIHVDGSHTLIVLSQDPDTSCPLHSARALTQCVCPSSVNSSGGRHNQREPRCRENPGDATPAQQAHHRCRFWSSCLFYWYSDSESWLDKLLTATNPTIQNVRTMSII